MSVSVATMQMAKKEWANHTPLELIVYILKTLSWKLYFITCSIKLCRGIIPALVTLRASVV